MKPTRQTRQGAPQGNCYAACIASIFELPLSAVPDPRWPPSVPWEGAWEEGATEEQKLVIQRIASEWDQWRAARGLAAFTLAADGWIPPGYAVGAVTNLKGQPHAVVVKDGQIVWDPSPAADSYQQPLQRLTYFVLADPSIVRLAARSQWYAPIPVSSATLVVAESAVAESAAPG